MSTFVIDVDGVVCNLLETVKHGLGLDASYQWVKYTEIMEPAGVMELLGKVKTWEHAEKYPQAVERVTRLLRDGNTIILVSQPWEHMNKYHWVQARSLWIMRTWPEYFGGDQLHFVPCGEERTFINCDWFVDDRPEYVEQWAMHTWIPARAWLVNQPYNRDSTWTNRITHYPPLTGTTEAPVMALEEMGRKPTDTNITNWPNPCTWNVWPPPIVERRAYSRRRTDRGMDPKPGL